VLASCSLQRLPENEVFSLAKKFMEKAEAGEEDLANPYKIPITEVVRALDCLYLAKARFAQKENSSPPRQSWTEKMSHAAGRMLRQLRL
jgi:transcription initiation factor IIE alpha subunit